MDAQNMTHPIESGSARGTELQTVENGQFLQAVDFYVFHLFNSCFVLLVL